MVSANRWMKISVIILNVTVLIFIIHVIILLNAPVETKDARAYTWYSTPKSHHTDKHRVSSSESFYNTETRKHKVRRDKMLLFWTPQHWFEDWVGNKWDTSHVFSKCSVSNCVLTKRREYLSKADVVLFRARDLKSCQQKKKRGQIWIIFEHEAPPEFVRHISQSENCSRNLFNWTMTYRRDSDLMFVHGKFSNVTSLYNESEIDKTLKAKTKTAVAFISHCPTQSQRLEYIRKLRQYGVDIDIYGRCGTLQCRYKLGLSNFKAVWNLTPNMSMERDCFEVLDSRYKFYLSFENGLCDDYVTEKSLHLVLRHKIVPIIRDAANHSLFHPPNSYLDTKDFKNIKSLANRIKVLSRNFDEYKKCLQWKKYFSSETVSGVLQTNLCDICKRLNNQHKYQRQYRNIVEFFVSRNPISPICHKPADV
ncbi:alpha-(1,3)-fucosyltransferase C-like [Pecten maximus]|uniref:alpha-(1,3)-fucosyltransferase C-like n=1 Tax=Pecten maximus TaxID=6579 RepID=UPI001457F949|nr:alpha-(1,3)-fucosyltransferase C-like [Pecten maximus]